MSTALARSARYDIQSHVAGSAEELARLGEAWNSLCQRCSEATVFSSWEWTCAVWRHTNRHCRPFVVVITDETGIIGIAPLGIDSSKWPIRALRFLSSGELDGSYSDYGTFVIADGKEEAVLVAATEEILKHSGEWDVLDLQEVPEHSSAIRVWLDQLDIAGLSFAVIRQNNSYPVLLPGSWSAYTKGLSANFRSTIRRQSQKLAREHDIRVELVDNTDRLREGMQVLYTLHGARWGLRGQPGIFGDQRIQRFHLDAATELLKKGWLSLSIMTADRIPIGAIYGFRYRGAEYFYASGYQTSKVWAPYSLGILLIAHSIEAAIAAGLGTYDLLRGDGEYKSRFGPQQVHNYRILAATSSHRIRLYSWVRKAHKAIARLKRRLAPDG